MATETCTDSSSSSSTNRSNNTIIPLLILLTTTAIFSATAPPVAGEPPNVVPFACKDAAAAAGGTFTEDFCLSTLQGSKSASAADYADLALVAVVRRYQPECRAAVKDGRYGDGKACLGRTAHAARACERWFRQRIVASPVAAEDDVLAKLANLAIALASIA